MKRVLTGIQPTGVITLGNYIGAIKQMLEFQEEYESFLFIADMHAITVPTSAINLGDNTRSLLALYLACGIDPNKNIIFLQSQNLYHANLSWILECNSYFGELSRMHQFKEKSSKGENFTAGLFTYPVLMAADILLYDSDIVPVGIDQKQHVELARDIAIRFNNKYGDTFKVPDVMIKKEGTKIMDLQDPTKKMSKSSDNPKGVIRLLDDLESVRKKIMSATTDSESIVKYDEVNKPGISNLINIYSVLTNKKAVDIEEEFKNSNYATFKRSVADQVVSVLKDIQTRYYEYLNSSELDKILTNGLLKTEIIAKEKLDIVKERIGFYK
ncbi:MAG TPA: tryptophan--tRNA ligase [Bacilli bacterium]|nr:tryptophan--tRNA ligase [Bacilli bacterium]